MIEKMYNEHTENLVAVCINEAKRDFSGVWFNRYEPEPRTFHSVVELLAEMDHFFDVIRFPQRANQRRTFGRKKTESDQIRKGMKAMNNSDLTKQRGDIATFVVHVQYRQNSSWQGTVTWADRDEQVIFRSALELIRLMDEAVKNTGEQGKNQTK